MRLILAFSLGVALLVAAPHGIADVDLAWDQAEHPRPNREAPGRALVTGAIVMAALGVVASMGSGRPG
jgi:hypothetical protein